METRKNPDRTGIAITTTLIKTFSRFLIVTLLMLSVLFLAAGRLDWWEAWAYIGQALFVLILSRTVMILKNPDTAKERVEAAQKEGVKTWDKTLMPLTAVVLPFVSWVVAGLDERFGWSPDLPDVIQVIALAVIFLSSMFGTWAMLANRFFSSHVRIQTERGHNVVDRGPYRIVRHPGYAGLLLSWVAAPVFFSSYWVAVPAVIAIAASAWRTALEDRTLQEELPGYKEYTSRVRYRLVPGIW
jgi:protein-S-isoprenylcysteine O-methyltransferase Ste14